MGGGFHVPTSDPLGLSTALVLFHGNLVVADDLSELFIVELFMLGSCLGKRSMSDGLRLAEDRWDGLDCSEREREREREREKRRNAHLYLCQ